VIRGDTIEPRGAKLVEMVINLSLLTTDPSSKFSVDITNIIPNKYPDIK